MSESLISLLTALGDDELVLGHRHSEWTGHAPHIEEDVAFSSIAQDEIGHAAGYFSLLGEITGEHPDEIALGRAKDAYRHAVICERPNGDWAYTLARHWLYDHADDIRLEALTGSAHEGLAALTTKLRREERYHLIHADMWMKRLASGPVEARSLIIDAIGRAFPEAIGLFEPFEREDEALGEGWLPEASVILRARFVKRTVAALDEHGLPTEMVRGRDDSAEFVASSSGDLIVRDNGDRSADEPAAKDGLGGRRGNHGRDFGELWEIMTSTYRAEPGATW